MTYCGKPPKNLNNNLNSSSGEMIKSTAFTNGKYHISLNNCFQDLYFTAVL